MVGGGTGVGANVEGAIVLGTEIVAGGAYVAAGAHDEQPVLGA